MFSDSHPEYPPAKRSNLEYESRDLLPLSSVPLNLTSSPLTGSTVQLAGGQVELTPETSLAYQPVTSHPGPTYCTIEQVHFFKGSLVC